MRDFSKKKRIVIKVGSSSLIYKNTQALDLGRMDILVRCTCDIKNSGRDVAMVSSGAIVAGKKHLGLESAETLCLKQACASVGQGILMTTYQKLFSEYNNKTSQILLTKDIVLNETRMFDAKNTFNTLFEMGVIPVINENDTISTDEIRFGDNDTLSAVVAAISGADLLIMLSDIDGLFTADPYVDENARLITEVEEISDDIQDMARKSSSNVGTGGMQTKITAAKIANDSGCDMVIANGNDFRNISRIMAGEEIGTLFKAHRVKDFNVREFIINWNKR
ncbi:MAG: glutamate 5-kinase [Lachnospiraceae bacterium]|nr:glutamate 5-kinase [Lachnospiraceae bacterium]